jgi:hypothetical protein
LFHPANDAGVNVLPEVVAAIDPNVPVSVPCVEVPTLRVQLDGIVEDTGGVAFVNTVTAMASITVHFWAALVSASAWTVVASASPTYAQ